MARNSKKSNNAKKSSIKKVFYLIIVIVLIIVAEHTIINNGDTADTKQSILNIILEFFEIDIDLNENTASQDNEVKNAENEAFEDNNTSEKNNIDNVIAMIKSSGSAAEAKERLMAAYNLTEVQAKAILDMKLSKLAKLEKEEIENEKNSLENEIKKLNTILENPIPELINIYNNLVNKYGDERRSTIIQVAAATKEEKEI